MDALRFDQKLRALRLSIDHKLEETCDLLYKNEQTLAKACRYGLLSGGKRVRASLVLAVSELLGARPESGWPPAMAVEMIHAYSLVHDDLPACDNDHLRRGKPSTHAAFGETTALLAGDALLTDAFHIIASTDLPPRVVVAMTRLLTESSGSQGMVGGQMLDLVDVPTKLDLSALCRRHQLKTGRLLGAACGLGALAAERYELVSDFVDFGHKIGLAFQILDDLLDLGNGTGKSKGKDQDQGKVTFVDLLSADKAQSMAEDLTHQALGYLTQLDTPSSPQFLHQYSLSLLSRQK